MANSCSNYLVVKGRPELVDAFLTVLRGTDPKIKWESGDHPEFSFVPNSHRGFLEMLTGVKTSHTFFTTDWDPAIESVVKMSEWNPKLTFALCHVEAGTGIAGYAVAKAGRERVHVSVDSESEIFDGIVNAFHRSEVSVENRSNPYTDTLDQSPAEEMRIREAEGISSEQMFDQLSAKSRAFIAWVDTWRSNPANRGESPSREAVAKELSAIDGSETTKDALRKAAESYVLGKIDRSELLGCALDNDRSARYCHKAKPTARQSPRCSP